MNIIVWDSGVTQPKDKGILLKDIIESDRVDREKSFCIDANYAKGGNEKRYTQRHSRQLVITGDAFRGRNPENPSDRTAGIDTEQRLEINQTGKSNALTSVSKDSLCIEIGKANIKGNEQIKRFYSPEGKSPCINTCEGGHREPKISENNITWRKLTPVECERLQTVNTIHEIEAELCEDQIKNYVSAVEKSHRLQKLALSVEKKELIEFVNLVVKNIQQNNPQIKHIVPQSADTLIQKIINKYTNLNQEEKNIIVDFAEKKTMSNYQNLEGDFVIQNVFTNIIQEKIINYGKAGLHLKDRNLCYQSSGKKRLKLSGKEIMQFVEIADMIFQKTEIEKCTSTTLYRLNIINIDQILIILYWYAKVVIDIFTLIEIPIKNILLNYSFENSYTNHVSNSQRYKMLGNGWTVDVIAHIFSYIQTKKP